MNREIAIYAFRYALGRMTHSTSTVSDYILQHWKEFSDSDKELFKREIKEAIDSGCAGHQCDIDSWKRILVK